MRSAIDVIQNFEFPGTDDWFYDAFMLDDDTFIDQEGEFWDFKENWPFSYSDDYFVGLAKLFVALRNTMGGFIVFGVSDQDRKPTKNLVRPNADKFNSALNNALSIPVEFKLKSIKTKRGAQIHVLLVPPREKFTRPLHFREGFAQSKNIQKYWVRSGFETIAAGAKHIPVLFCGSGQIKKDDASIDSFLPPNPAAIKQFVARLDPVAKLFEWLDDPNEPRAFLYGRGGSGKTTVAYEFARHIAAFGKNIRIRGKQIQKVIFLSSKAIELSPHDYSRRAFQGKDFSTVEELICLILMLGGWADYDELIKLSLDNLYDELQNYCNIESSLIVIDDIDTLTTKGIDAGFDQFFRVAIKADCPIKLLYTQRNEPTQSMRNSIEIPGLAVETEYPDFVKVCSDQFKLPTPTSAFVDKRLADLTERRPLIIESIIGLRRSSGTYERAADLFEQNVGADARSYVFEREWDSLKTSYARHLVAALALYGKALPFEEIKTILQLEDSRILEAISETRVMFLEVDHVKDEAYYRLGELTRSFALEKAKRLDLYPVIVARVNSFKKSHFPELPELSRLMGKCENLIRLSHRTGEDSHLREAWRNLTEPTLPPKVTEDPRFRAFRGYVGTKQNPPEYATLRDDFKFAFDMKYSPPEEHVRAWFIAEERSGEAASFCPLIVERVLESKSYSAGVKNSYLSRKAGFHYNRGKQERHLNPEQSTNDLTTAVFIHADVYHNAVINSDIDVLKYNQYYRNTCLLLFLHLQSTASYEQMVDTIIDVAKKDKVFIDPMAQSIIEYLLPSVRLPAEKGKRDRLIGKLKHAAILMEKAMLWEDSVNQKELLSTVNTALSERAF